MDKKAPKVTVETHDVNTDPQVKILQIKLEGESGIWTEAPKTESEAYFFFRGMQAMNSYAGLPGLLIPIIPSTD